MKLHVVIATLGRAELTKLNVTRLFDQTEPPDGVVVCGASEADIAGIKEQSPRADVMVGPMGSCHQRNTALASIVDKTDIVCFIDDDFIPQKDYFEQVRKTFASREDVIGVTGFLLADGATNEGIQLNKALEILADASQKTGPHEEQDMQALYGCNMSFRTSVIQDIRFDENLPLYAWQEDIDFSYQVGKKGRLLKTSDLTGVHLGVKRGRTSGVRFGYSQIANIVYLKRKGTMQPGLGEKMMTRNLISNLFKSISPENYIDRRGRLKGNFIALKDLMAGKIHPTRILNL